MSKQQPPRHPAIVLGKLEAVIGQHALVGDDLSGYLHNWECSCGDELASMSHAEHVAAQIAEAFPHVVTAEARWRVDFAVGDLVILTGADWPDEHDEWIEPARGTTHRVAKLSPGGVAHIEFFEGVVPLYCAIRHDVDQFGRVSDYTATDA